MNDMSEPWREYQRLEARITRPGLYLSRVQYLPLICINTRSRVRWLIAVQQSRWSQSTFDQYRPNHIRSCEASHSRASLSPQRDCLRTRRTSPVRLLGRSRLVVSFPANVGRPEVDTAVFFPGDGFGYEVGRHHRDTVQALTPIKVLAVARDALLAAATTDARLSNLLFSAAASAAVAADERADMMRVKNAAERIAQFLLEMEIRLSSRGVIDLPMSRSQIGDYFGVRIETVSRTFSAFQKEKIFEFRDRKQRQMVICDKRRLQQLASDASDFDYWSILKKGRKAANATKSMTRAEPSIH